MGLLFVESIRRLYKDNKIDMQKIVELFESGKITDEEKKYILDVKTQNKTYTPF